MSTASTTLGPAGAETRVQAFVRRLRSGDQIAHVILMIFGATIVLITALLVYELWVNSHASRAQFGLKFLF